MSRPRILFGDHATQAPAIQRYIDHRRFDVTFAAFESAEFSAFDLIVPLRVEEIALARVASDFAPRRMVLPDAAMVALCDDKLAFNRRLIALGFGAMVPELLGNAPDRYPYIRKARRGDFGVGCRMVRAAVDDVEPIPDSFCQRAVEGPLEYVLHLLRVDGRIRFALAYRYDMGDPLAVRGAAQAARTTTLTDPATALAPCSAMLDALGYEGTCCFNYKIEDSTPQILELNPRFGGSLVGEVTNYVAAHLDAL